ncbi:MAG: nucleotide exchange factor GrpE [Deltaproteobacteria bacterium]|nr:nucleotide exchange factor GrpE [Deltaproteobacteria bacterium]
MAEDDAVRPGSDETSADETSADAATSPGRDGGAEADTSAGATSVAEVERLRAEVAELKDRLLRERAELENFKRRQARDKAEALRFANEGLLRDLLPIIDNLHRAVEHARTSHEVDAIADGVDMTMRSLTDALERHGVKIVEALGRPFDPTHHEAIGHVESEHPPNTVVDEHQRGYLLHDRLLRPALVTVGKPPATSGER